MQLVFPFPPIILTIACLTTYGASLWWLLRLESKRTLWTLSALSLIALILRIIFIHDYPPGVNDDEVQTLRAAFAAIESGKIFALGVEGPILPAVLFQVPVAIWLDSLFWGMRLYPITLSVLAIPVCFTIGQAMRFTSLASHLLAALVSVLPWSLFWSRMPWGGEIIFYQCLLVAAVARVIWQGGGRGDVLVGIVGLSGLLWEYTGAWSMISIPLIGIVLAPGWNGRRNSLLILLGGIALWLPYLLNVSSWWVYISQKTVDSSDHQTLAATYSHYRPLVEHTLETFVAPVGNSAWISMHSVAIHPIAVLITAVLGLLCVAPRKALLIIGGFAAGFSTAVVSYQGAPSTHRMMCAFLFISIASAAFFNAIATKFKNSRLSNAATWSSGIFVIATATESLLLFFSPAFWTQSDQVFFHGETLVSESLPLPATSSTILDAEIFRYIKARDPRTTQYKRLTYENWHPLAPGRQTLSRPFKEWFSFYQDALPPQRVQLFADSSQPTSLIATFTEEDVLKWNQYGWTLRISCRDSELAPVIVRTPLLAVEQRLAIDNMPCGNTKEYTFSGVWLSAPTDLNLHIAPNVIAKIETSSGPPIKRPPPEQGVIRFSISTGDTLRITIASSEYSANALLVEGPLTKQRIPRLESFRPTPP